ncbi:hypothetical protein OAA09_01115 [bacterium]|nr:hypothetical protein [bacterium]
MFWASIGLTFIIGVVVGGKLQKHLFINQDWTILRWNDGVFGYRPVPGGHRIFRNEKVKMALKLETSEIPEEGFMID